MQKPFDHSLPSRAEIQAAEATKAKDAQALAVRAARWRTTGIWAFGMTAAAMAGAVVVEAITSYPRDVTPGIIGGAAGFACLRLLLAERRDFRKIDPSTKR